MTAVVLDCQALSLLLRDDRAMAARIDASREEGVPVLVSSMTVIEATGPRIGNARLAWVLSRLVVEPVTQADALTANRLLAEHGLHGHKYAIDAAVASLALRVHGPAVVLTSDPEGFGILLGGTRIRVLKV